MERFILLTNLSFYVVGNKLKDVLEGAVEIRFVCQDGKSEGIAYIEFKTETGAEKNYEEKQGAEADEQCVSFTTLDRKDKSKREMERVALGVVNQKVCFT